MQKARVTPLKSGTRPKIPKSIAEEVLFRAAMRCCVCRERGDQIHHVDGDRTNNRLENLVFLCYKDHNDASVKGALQRKLTPELLKRFREEWCEKVRSERRPQENHASGKSMDLEELNFQLVTDAVIIVEVYKLRRRSGRHEWDKMEDVISELRSFTGIAGVRARKVILDFLQDMSSKTRFWMPLDIARVVVQITFDFLPIDSLRKKADTPPTAGNVELLNLGIEIAEDLIYDGAVKLRNPAIALEGCELMWQIHLFARINELDSVLTHLGKKFEWLFSTLNRPGLESAVRLNRIFYDHTFSKNPEYPNIPVDLDREIVETSTRGKRGQ